MRAGRVEWDWEDGYYVADFYDDRYETEAWFTPGGEWVMTETDIPYAALPQAVKTAFEGSEYADWRVDDADQVERRDMETLYGGAPRHGDPLRARSGVRTPGGRPLL